MIAIARLSERSFCAPDILWCGDLTEKAGILNVNREVGAGCADVDRPLPFQVTFQ